jgi:hypothetical protein
VIIETMAVEGSLGVLWLNAPDTTATPRYALIFSRYAGFKNGAQQSLKTNSMLTWRTLRPSLNDKAVRLAPEAN